MPSRRDFLVRFLATAAGAAVAHTLDLDKLLWTPGARTIFVPPLVVRDAHIGISIRFIREWDVVSAAPIARGWT